MSLNVSFGSPLPVDFVRSSFSEIYSLQTYWPKDWSIVEVYYNQPPNNKSSYAIVKLASKSGGERPLMQILEKIRKHIESPATMVVGNKQIRFKKSLSAYSIFVIDTSLQNLVPWWLRKMKDKTVFENIVFNISQYAVDKVEINNDIFGFALKSSITKLSLCDQVEIYEDDADFIDALRPYLLRLKANGKLLFEDQFLATRNIDNTNFVFRICLEDSPFNKIKTSCARQFKPCYTTRYLMFQLLLLRVLLKQI